MNNPFSLRKRADYEKLKKLESRIPRFLKIVDTKGDPPNFISLKITVPTALSADFPATRQEASEVDILLPERYPFQLPVVTFRTPIWNPNVYTSGKWCYGNWQPTENLELFVTRLMKTIALDPSIINPSSPANAEAAAWYQQAKRRKRSLFPTVQLSGVTSEPEKPKMMWRTIK